MPTNSQPEPTTTTDRTPRIAAPGVWGAVAAVVFLLLIGFLVWRGFTAPAPSMEETLQGLNKRGEEGFDSETYYRDSASMPRPEELPPPEPTFDGPVDNWADRAAADAADRRAMEAHARAMAQDAAAAAKAERDAARAHELEKMRLAQGRGEEGETTTRTRAFMAGSILLDETGGATGPARATTVADNQRLVGAPPQDLATTPPYAPVQQQQDGEFRQASTAVKTVDAVRLTSDPCKVMRQDTPLVTVSLEPMDTTHPGRYVGKMPYDFRLAPRCPVLFPRNTLIHFVVNSNNSVGDFSIQVVATRAQHQASNLDVALLADGAGRLGTIGVPATYDSRFWFRIREGLLLGLIGSVVSAAVGDKGEGDEAREDVARTFEGAAAEALRYHGDIPPRLHNEEGTIVVFKPANDISFEGVL